MCHGKKAAVTQMPSGGHVKHLHHQIKNKQTKNKNTEAAIYDKGGHLSPPDDKLVRAV